MSEFPNTPQERALLANELALGLLEGEELALAERLQLSDPDFAAQVAKAERDMAPLHEAFPETAAPEGLKARVNAAIDGERAPSAEPTLPFPANDTDPGPWKLIAIAASILALVLAGMLAFQAVSQPADAPPSRIAGGEQTAPAAQYVAQLATDEEGEFVVVSWSADSNSLDVRTIGLEDDALAPELWVIPEDGKPRSFGTSNGNGRGELAIPGELARFLTDGATLAVTMEDPASAPHDAPTPPIIAIGTLLEI